MTRMMKMLLVVGLLCLSAPFFEVAHAQGQDGTEAERNIQILAKLLPGRYDNANQTYFDERLNKPRDKRHSRLNMTIASIDAPTLGKSVFEANYGDPQSSTKLVRFALEVDNRAEAVRMKIFRANGIAKDDENGSTWLASGCDILWREEAGQFHGAQEKVSCKSGSTSSIQMADFFLSQDAFWVDFQGDTQNHFKLERARTFSCYVDVPGVGGGVEIPYKRYEIQDIHDKGGKSWITLDDGTEISVTLQNIRWPMNNLENIFTRHSLVIYIGKRENGEEKQISYAWTIPEAQRIGINLKWMLTNCFMLSNEDVEPYFKAEPRL